MAEGFAIVPTWMIRDTSIPRSALLVYAALSSRSGYKAIFPSQETIAQESGLGLRTVRKMLKELEALGVLTRERRRVKGVKRSTDAYRLHPNGLAANSAGSEDLPATEDASTGNQRHVTPSYTDRESEIDNPLTPTGGDELTLATRALVESEDLFAAAFQTFYTVYPRKVGKEAARRAYAKAARRVGGFADINDGARRFAADPNLPTDRQFIPYPATWLNRGGWEDEPLPPRASGQQGTAVERMAQRLAQPGPDDWGRHELGQ